MAKQVLFPDEKGRPFARAVRAGQLLFIAGMTGQWDLTTWERDPKSIGDVVYQTRRIFEHASIVLSKCGLTVDEVVMTTTFLRSMKDLAPTTEVRREYLGNSATDTCVAVSDFVGLADIEINFIAVYPEGR